MFKLEASKTRQALTPRLSGFEILNDAILIFQILLVAGLFEATFHKSLIKFS